MAKRCLDDTDYWKRKPCTKDCIYSEKCIYRNNKEVAKKKETELKEQERILKSSNRHDIGELQIYQAYSLERKIQLTCERIQAWYEWWDGQVYISFSGGKDSTVLLDLVRNECGYKDVPAVFIDTGLEYPEIRDFVKTFDNVIWLKPKMNFKQVIKKYGYPFISKEVSECVYGAKQYLTSLLKQITLDKQASKQASKQAPYKYYYDKLCGQGKYSKQESGGADRKYRKLRGIGEFAKPKNEEQRGRQELQNSTNVGNVRQTREHSSKGEYP